MLGVLPSKLIDKDEFDVLGLLSGFHFMSSPISEVTVVFATPLKGL